MFKKCILALLLLTHNIAWSINKGFYIPLSVGIGEYTNPSNYSQKFNANSDKLWDKILASPKKIGIDKSLMDKFRKSLTLDKDKEWTKIADIGIGYQLNESISIELKGIAHNAKMDSPTWEDKLKGISALIPSKKNNGNFSEIWKYGLSASIQASIPLFSSTRLYGKLGKTLIIHRDASFITSYNEFGWNKLKEAFNNEWEHFSLERIGERSQLFYGAGFRYQWSSNKLIDLSWECYPHKSDECYIHFAKLGLNWYL